MSGRPMVSVALAACNGEKYLEAQVRSILPELAAGDELILSVNPSADGTLALARRLAQEDRRITVIPCGEAIQLARASRLNNVGEVPADTRAYDLTRDGYHLSRQFGRYLAACTWFEMLVAPTVGVPLSKAHSTLRDTEYSLSPKDARLCRRIAVKACKAQRAK